MSALPHQAPSSQEPATSSAQPKSRASRETGATGTPVLTATPSLAAGGNTPISSVAGNSTAIPSTAVNNSNAGTPINANTTAPPATPGKKPGKSNKPKVTRLRQQKLKSWQPTLTAKTVIPAIFLIAVIFVPVGIALLIASESVKEWTINYSDNCPMGPCTLSFSVESDFKGDVFFYYTLKNYFQNHRRYLKSRNDNQLLGTLTSTAECDPYDKVNTTNGMVPIAPCGAVANSMFNDSFTLYKGSSGNPEEQVTWTYKGVVWDVDLQKKFKNPTIPSGGSLCDAFANTSKPVNWGRLPCHLDDNNPDNNGFLNTDFIVWMRTAALPAFRKPYRKLVRTGTFANGLPAGDYVLVINNIYPVKQFNGRKQFVISTASWAGGKNSFLGIIYIVVGGLCFLVGFLFIFIHLKWGRSH
uniref:Cell cycle control protein n=1 Tax=Panagrellus redivivus TaxID=6233 RepID=A0A7E4WA15_PANRE